MGDEYFCILRRRGQHETQRRVIVEQHGDVYSGLVKYAENELRIGDVQESLSRLHRKVSGLGLWCSREELPKDSPFHVVATALAETAEFMRNEILDSLEKLEDMSRFGMTAWVNEEGNDSYFELQVSPEHLEDVELACAKLYINDLRMHVIFIQSSYYCTLEDLSSTEQQLEDKEFPDISSRGAGLQLVHYQNQRDFKKLTIWQSLKNCAFNMKEIMKERAERMHESKSEQKLALDEEGDDHEDFDDFINESANRDLSGIDEDALWGRSKEAFSGSFTQCYLMLKAQDDTTARRALFRYGNWCYGGEVDMDQDVTLHELPHVLRKFQKQQGRLAYWFEIQKIPDGLPFSQPMKHFAMACSFIEEELSKSENTLAKVSQFHKSRGIDPWVDQENGKQFFELETSGKQPHYSEVEFMASKTYYHGVVVITIYFGGSFYVTLSPSVGDQPLLDMSFPDVESRARALQLFTYTHPEFKKFMLWESQRSVWETANRAVLEQRRLATLQKQKQEQLNVKRIMNQMEQDLGHEEEVVDCAVESSETKTPSSESKSEVSNEDDIEEDEEQEVPTKINERDSVIRNEIGSEIKQRPNQQRSSLESKFQGPAARAPHHLKPLGKAEGSGKLPSLSSDFSSMEAPWDSTGKPKNFFKK